jgi:hypothetical protein
MLGWSRPPPGTDKGRLRQAPHYIHGSGVNGGDFVERYGARSQRNRSLVSETELDEVGDIGMTRQARRGKSLPLDGESRTSSPRKQVRLPAV